MKKAWFIALAMLLSTGCRDGEGSGTGEGTDTSGGPPPDTTSSSTDPDSDTTESGGSTEPEPVDPPRHDVLAIPDAPGSDIEGCKAVDFLFVIDNSGSMSDEQDNLTASFPGFFAAIVG